MLACHLDVQVEFDIPLTIFSAFVAVAFTFAAFSSAYISETVENSKIALELARWGRCLTSMFSPAPFVKHHHDLEAAEYLPVSTVSDDGGDIQPVESAHDEDDEEVPGDEEDMRDQELRGRSPNPSFSAEASGHNRTDLHTQTSPMEDSPKRAGSPSSHGLRSSINFLSASSNQVPTHSSGAEHSRQQRDASTTPSDFLSTDGSSSKDTLTRSRSNSINSHSLSLSSTTASSNSWNEPLHTGLSRETRLRIKANARDRPVPNFGWKYWLKTHYNTVTPLVFIRASVWALAIVFMHYSGKENWDAFLKTTFSLTFFFNYRHVGHGDT